MIGHVVHGDNLEFFHVGVLHQASAGYHDCRHVGEVLSTRKTGYFMMKCKADTQLVNRDLALDEHVDSFEQAVHLAGKPAALQALRINHVGEPSTTPGRRSGTRSDPCIYHLKGEFVMRIFVNATIAASLLLLSACSDNDSDSDPSLTDQAQVENDGPLPSSDDPVVERDDPSGLGNIVEIALQAGNLDTLAAALEASDLVSVLADESQTYTVFAPTDEAFAKLGEDAVNDLLADPDKLRDILLYHVVPAAAPAAAVDAATALSLAGTTVTTADDDDIAVSLVDEKLFINTAEVIATDIVASNGIIHLIDSVLIPPVDMDDDAILGSIVETAAAAGSFNTLVAALQATGLDAVLADTESTFTVFAPTDEAFAKLGDETINALLADPDALTDILLYHVIGDQAVDSTTAISLAGNSVATLNGADVSISLDGPRLLINDSTVVIPDVFASNGIIHAIDTVLLLPGDEVADGDDESSENGSSDESTLLDIARNNADFSTLVAAIEATGLDSAIGHPDDTYTIFAPNNAAFAALGEDTINALLADPDTLRDILLYHVIPGTVFDAEAAVSLVGTSIEAGNGSRFTLRLDGEDLLVNDSRIIATDIFGVNGVIHVIDAVLIP